MNHIFKIPLYILLALVCGCSPHSSEEFQQEADSHISALVQQMRAIETREQLTHGLPQLKKQFESLVTLMIAAREFQERHPDEASNEVEGNPSSALLAAELRRLYLLEGGREAIEKAQHEALSQLDAYERRRLKRREKGVTH